MKTKYKGAAAGLDKLCRRFEEAREKHVTQARDPKPKKQRGKKKAAHARDAHLRVRSGTERLKAREVGDTGTWEIWSVPRGAWFVDGKYYAGADIDDGSYPSEAEAESALRAIAEASWEKD